MLTTEHRKILNDLKETIIAKGDGANAEEAKFMELMEEYERMH